MDPVEYYGKCFLASKFYNAIISLYDETLTFHSNTNTISICDVEFESSLSFSKDANALKEAFKESPEYFSNKILISVYHFIKTGEIAEANEIIGEIESRITGRGACLSIEYALNLVGNGYEWIDFAIEDQIEVVGNNIEKLLS